MIRSSLPPRLALKPTAPWAGILVLASGLLFGGSQAWAAAPPANTVIGNQATADYIDPNGLTQSATSNMVRTTVQQVGSFNLDGYTTASTVVVNTKTGAASAVLYAPHVLTNTGNGADGFAIKVEFPNTPNTLAGTSVYADANFDGLPDSTTALCSVTPVPVGTTSVCNVPAQTVAGNNGQFGFVVAYQLPSTLSGSVAPYALAKVTATPAALAMYAVGNQSVGTVDQVNTTNAAAFNLTKAVQQPLNGIAAPGGGAWPAAPVSGRRSSDASCATSWSAGLTSSATCQYTVYTLTYSNSGGAPGRFVMQDALNTAAMSGMQYVAGSAVWSGNSGVGMTDAQGGETGVDYAFDATSNTMTFVDETVPVNVQRSVSFVVLVKNTAAVGTTTTTNVARYNPVSDLSATTSAPGPGVSSATNSATFTVQGTYSIAMGASPSTAATALDATPGTPNATSSTGDTTTVGNAAAGAAVAFTQIVYNTGNDTDTVNITSANPGTATGTQFPAGTTFAYYKADGATPLNDTNADGTVDTGPIAAGGSVNIVVKAVLPGTATPAPAASYTFTVTGTSSGDSTKLDATRNVLTSVTGALVDLTNSENGSDAAGTGDLGTGPSTQPTTTATVTAGASHAFELWVKNNDSVDNTYSLAASSTTTFPGTLPAGWTVKFVAGAATPASCASAAAITTLPVILAAKPGECITYVVTATNEGTATLTNLTIYDAIPAYTSLNATQPTATAQCVWTGITGPLTPVMAYAAASGSVSCGSATNTVSPGATATLTFQVKVNQ